MTPWNCARCNEDQLAFGPLPEDLLCYACHEAEQRKHRFTEAGAGIPVRYRRLTREGWSTRFECAWPTGLEQWKGDPQWVAIWGPTGTGKTSLATILLAEHLRTGRRGHWISGSELSRRIQRDFANAEEVIAPLVVTPLLIFDEPLAGASADWYLERLILITRTRDENCLPTVVTCQLLPELLANPNPMAPPPLVSRWLSGLRIQTGGDDVRLQEAL